MAPVVIYDACVLHPAPLRDLLIRIARAGLVRARWTEQILDETFRSVLRRRPELEVPLRRTRELMIMAVPDCLVVGHEDLIRIAGTARSGRPPRARCRDPVRCRDHRHG